MFKIGDMVCIKPYRNTIGRVIDIVNPWTVLIEIVFTDHSPEIGLKINVAVRALELIELGKPYGYVREGDSLRIDSPKQGEKTCICSSRDLFIKGCKCGAISAKKWGLGA